jgi:hypothetical protein
VNRPAREVASITATLPYTYSSVIITGFRIVSITAEVTAVINGIFFTFPSTLQVDLYFQVELDRGGTVEIAVDYLYLP